MKPRTRFTNRQGHSSHISFLSAASVTSLLLLLSACGGGGGAGDDGVSTGPDNSILLAFEPVVGVWNLPGNWSGEQNDQAALLIRSPGPDNTSEVVIYDFDDAATGLGQDCYFIDVDGDITLSITQELFMDISAFPDAIVSITPSENLSIAYTADGSTGIDRQITTITAQRLELTEAELTPLCTN